VVAFLAAFFTVFLAAFLGEAFLAVAFLAAFLTVFLAAFLGDAFFAAAFLAGAFFAAFFFGAAFFLVAMFPSAPQEIDTQKSLRGTVLGINKQFLESADYGVPDSCSA